MAIQKTLSIIKPDAVRKNCIGEITKRFENAGLKVIAAKMESLNKEQVEKFYEIHKERPFYGELCAYMSSGAIFPMILEKDNAVEDFRKLIGATDPKKAAPGTIRALFAKSIDANAIHGSDSDENAALEGNFFFSQFERF